MSAISYTHVCQLSKVNKYCMLVDSAYQVYWVASLLNQLASGHKQLLLHGTSTQGIEYLKAPYTLVEAKVVTRDCSRLRTIWMKLILSWRK